MNAFLPCLPPRPEVPSRRDGLEGGLQSPPRSLEVSFEAADAAPQDEVVEGKRRSFAAGTIPSC